MGIRVSAPGGIGPNVLVPGNNIAINATNPAAISIGSTLAFQGETDFTTAALDTPTSTVTYGVDPVFKQRVTNLELSRSLIQTKDAVGSSTSSNAMVFPGTTGNYISSPSNVAYDVAGDCSIVVRVKMPSSAPGADVVLVSRRGTTTATTQFSCFIKTTGQLQATVSVNGTTTAITPTTAATPLVFDGNWIWLRYSRTASTGQWAFYTAADTGSNNTIPSTWTAFQTNRGGAVGAMISGTGAAVEISGSGVGTVSMFGGSVGRALFYGAFTPVTPLFDANASDYITGSTWTDPQTRVWTIVGTASISTSSQVFSNTATEFTLSETDPFSGIPAVYRDTMMWDTMASVVNTSGSAVNFTPKLRVAGVDLFTFPAISLASAASSVYHLGCAVKLSINAVDGTTQLARAELIISAAATGTDLGGVAMAAQQAIYVGNRSAAIATITSIPNIQLKATFGTAASTISARHLRTQLFVAKA